MHVARQKETSPTEPKRTRWVVLAASIAGMVAVANYQYGWTFFVAPLERHLKVEQAHIQNAYTIFILLETWLVPFEGWLVDKFGPRFLVIVGGILAGSGWVATGRADTLTTLYLSYAVAGIGAGIVYGTAIGNALKWFPDRRGLAAGLTAAGYGAGSALTVLPISHMIQSAGYQATFIRWGIIQGAVVVVAALVLKSPPAGWMPATWNTEGGAEIKARQSPVDFSSREMVATPHFWLMYVIMTMVATGGLMATAQLSAMASDYNVDKVPIHFLIWVMPLVPFTSAAERVLNGVCRPFWGLVSDRIGRENTMALAFSLEALAIFLLIRLASNPLYFVLFSAVTFFGWGEIYSLFPALCGDFFGRKNATANYGFLYTAKGVAGVFVPIGSVLALGREWDFSADILLLAGGILLIGAVFILPRVLHVELGKGGRVALLAIAGGLMAYGLMLTVFPNLALPSLAKFTLPRAGWGGVFKIAMVFDVIAALLAYFVLRRMKAPVRATAVLKARATGAWRT